MLVTARRWTCQHEWLIHEKLARQAGLELLVLSGYYSLMAMVLNSAGLPLPGGAQPPLR